MHNNTVLNNGDTEVCAIVSNHKVPLKIGNQNQASPSTSSDPFFTITVDDKSKKSSNSLHHNWDLAILVYLTHIMHHFYEHILKSSFFDPLLVPQPMNEGFLPKLTYLMLLPELHRRRCAI